MNEYIKALKRYVADNPSNWGEYDTEGVLDMLYRCYNQYNSMDTPTITAAFEELYREMNGMPLREMDKIIDTVCLLCREHEHTGFSNGVKIGIVLTREIAE